MRGALREAIGRHQRPSEAIIGHQRTVARLDELELCVGFLPRDATRRAQLLHLMRGAIKGDEGRNLVGNRRSSVAAAPPCAQRPCIVSEALGGLPLPHLMRRAIKGSSKAIQGNPRQSKAIQGNPRQSKAIQGNPGCAWMVVSFAHKAPSVPRRRPRRRPARPRAQTPPPPPPPPRPPPQAAAAKRSIGRAPEADTALW